MYKKFKAVSLSHKSASVAIRELVALDEETCRRLLNYFKEFTDLTDVLILSTCNRTEVYYSAEEDRYDEVIKLIGIHKGIEDLTHRRDVLIPSTRARNDADESAEERRSEEVIKLIGIDKGIDELPLDADSLIESKAQDGAAHHGFGVGSGHESHAIGDLHTSN